MMQRACDVSFCMREAHVHMPRRVPLLWALLSSVGLHLALLADPPESWLESARQALAQPEDASSGELPLATQLLDMQEGAVAAALSARAQPSAALQVDWYRPPPPVPMPISSAAPPAESGMPGPAGGMATETASPPANDHDKAGAVVAADEGQEVSILPQSPDAPPLLPDVSALGQGKEKQDKKGQDKEKQGKKGQGKEEQGPASGDEPQNLSFKREFDKLIAHCDLLAQIIANKSNHTIIKMLQSLATAVFLPVTSP